MNQYTQTNAAGYPQQFLRKRKMMMVLPLLVLPFVTLAFWSLGGGKGIGVIDKHENNSNGLNLELPIAHLKSEKGLDKMSYYDLAKADSEKLKIRMRNDPYFKLKTSLAADTEYNGENNSEGDDSVINAHHKGLNISPYEKKGNTSSGEEKVYEKLRLIRATMDNVATVSRPPGAGSSKESSYENYIASTNTPEAGKENVDRLEKMMETVKQDNGSDSDMAQINSMLEKIMDIQHPERVNEKSRQNIITARHPILNVTRTADTDQGFYGLADRDTNAFSINSMEAMVPETQTLVNGSTLKLRLMDDLYISGILIPKGNFVFGKTVLTGERLSVSIGSIRYRNSLFPVDLAVYDMDGLDGIYIPGAITRDVARQSADNALQSVALNSLDPSIGAQAAGAGIETVKNLLSKKIKLVRVTVKTGYHVLLRNNVHK